VVENALSAAAAKAGRCSLGMGQPARMAWPMRHRSDREGGCHAAPP
jgi:hypothetical protein